MKSKPRCCFGSALLICSMVIFGLADCASGQLQQPANANGSAQKGQAVVVGAAAKKNQAYTPSVRVHLEKGSSKGYLVLQVDLSEGHHMYSLNPKGSPVPTKIVVTPSKDINVLGAFTSDKQPLVIEKDPVFQRRIEKHKGVVQFFAPIEVRPGMDLSKLTAEVALTGQVCSANACQPVNGKKIKGKFASFFEAPKQTTEKTPATTAGKPTIQR